MFNPSLLLPFLPPLKPGQPKPPVNGKPGPGGNATPSTPPGSNTANTTAFSKSFINTVESRADGVTNQRLTAYELQNFMAPAVKSSSADKDFARYLYRNFNRFNQYKDVQKYPGREVQYLGITEIANARAAYLKEGP